MKTDDLIIALASDVEPTSPHAVVQKLTLGLTLGALASFGIMILWLGVRPDIVDAMATGPFWMKFAYALSVAVLGFALIEGLARPSSKLSLFELTILMPVLVMIIVAIFQLSGAPADLRMNLTMGASYQVCTRNIVILSTPIFIGLFWALRSLAPTRLTLAGGVAGVLAGATGTFIYALHCNESAAPFVAIWYTLGMVAVGIGGALIGRLALRW